MIKELVPLRFVLILMIFFHHAGYFAGGGSAGVAYFFVLSGFCMMLGYRDRIVKDNFSYVAYIKKRFLKVYPLHWITLAVAVGLMIVQEHSCGPIKTLITNALLLQSWVPNMNIYFSYNAVSWYLSTALLAVVLFPMLVTFFEKVKIRDRYLFGILLLVAYIVIAFRIPTNERHAMLYIHPCARLVDFVVGMYVAYVWMSCRKNARFMHWATNHGWLLDMGFVLAFMVFIVIAVCANNDIRPIAGIYWLPVAVSLLCLVLGEGTNTWLHCIMKNEMVGVITRCSFSMMMWHLVVIQQITPPLRIGGVEVKFIASYIIAQISYYLIEKKLYDTSISRL